MNVLFKISGLSYLKNIFCRLYTNNILLTNRIDHYLYYDLKRITIKLDEITEKRNDIDNVKK